MLFTAQTTSMFSSFSAATSFLGRQKVPGSSSVWKFQCLAMAPMTLRTPRHLQPGNGFPVPNASPGRSLVSHTPDEPSHSLGTAWRKLRLAQLLRGSPGPLGHQRGGSVQAALLMLQEVEEHFVHVSIKPSFFVFSGSLSCPGCRQF